MSNLYKFKTRFKNIVKASANFDSSKFISKASLESLRSLIPASVDLENNIDLLGVSFNAAVVNRFNRNGDGLNSAAAAAIKSYFIHKPCNIEHNNTRIVGHIVNSGFSSFGDNRVLSDEDIKDEIGPFNISLAAVVYKTVEKAFCGALEDSSNPTSQWYNKISTSWEIGFNDYIIAVGSKNVKDAILITDPKQVEEYSAYLKCNGGSGKTSDGQPVYRLITGKIYPLGIGFTTNPAAEVSGVITVNKEIEDDESEDEEDEDEMEEEDGEDDKMGEKESECECIEVDSANFINNCSQFKEGNVILKQDNNNITVMDLNQIIAAFKAALAEKQADVKFSEESIASVSEKIAESIRTESVRAQAELEKSQKVQQEAIASADKLREDLDLNSKKLSETEQRLKDLEASLANKNAADLFNVRMAALDAEYDFESADRQLLAADLQSLASTDEAFAAYKEKLAVLYSHKNKVAKAAAEAEFNKRVEAETQKRVDEIAKASVKTSDIDAILAKLKPAKATVVPGNDVTVTQDSWSKFAEAFSKKNVVSAK
jgi:hypothetical protein